MRLLALTAAVALVGCTDEVEFERFNAEDDELSVEVGVSDAGPALRIDLHSNTGAVVVGAAEVTPGSGPSGTEHTLVVEVLDEFEFQVDRASVTVSSGDRGTAEFDLVPDSADEGIFVISLFSFADEGETRSDTLNIGLWDVVGDEDAGDGLLGG